jgi:hypothetical protein
MHTRSFAQIAKLCLKYLQASQPEGHRHSAPLPSESRRGLVSMSDARHDFLNLLGHFQCRQICMIRLALITEDMPL